MSLSPSVSANFAEFEQGRVKGGKMLTRSAQESAHPIKTIGSRMFGFLTGLYSKATSRRSERRLRISEMVSLGEKRFVAVVEYDLQKFLLAGTPQSISLLHRMDGGERKTDPAAHPESASGIEEVSGS